MCSFLQPPKSMAEANHVKFLVSVKRSMERAELFTCTSNFPVLSKKAADLRVQRVIERQSKPKDVRTLRKRSTFDPGFLREAYERCQRICAEYAKTYYLGTLLMTEERRKAIWALYVWCRRTDELVDGPNAEVTSSSVLERWEERLEDIFNGCPYDMLDAALADTIHRFLLDIKPFKEMIEGMRMDTWKDRYNTFEELCVYCYHVGGTVGLMSVPIMGISPKSQTSTQTIYNAAICLGIANQLTNILRDVGEDALRGRIYIPQEELREYGLKDEDIYSRKVTHEWKELMKKQIRRARTYYKKAEQGVSELDSASRWPVWSALMLYRRILEEIENNDYDNLTKRAYVGRPNKLLMLPLAYIRAMGL